MRRHLLGLLLAACVIFAAWPSAAGAVSVQIFDVPSANAGLSGITEGPDGNLWFTEENTFTVGKLSTSGQFSEYPVVDDNPGDQSSDLGPTKIVSGSDGQLWFLTDIGDTLERISTSGQVTVAYHDFLYPAGALTWGDNGSAWLFERNGDEDDDAIIHVTPSGSGFSASEGVPDTGIDNAVDAMATAPNGTAFFNVHNSGDSIASITDAGAVSTVPVGLPQPTQEIYALAVAGDGTPWFAVQNPGDTEAGYPGVGACCGEIGEVVNGQARLFPIGSQTQGQGLLPVDIIPGPDGAMWFSFISAYSNGYSGIGRITSSGQTQLLDLSPDKPTGIAFGSDGDLYFIDSAANSIGRITVSPSLFPSSTGVSSGGTTEVIRPALTVLTEKLTKLRISRILAVSCHTPVAATCSVAATVSAATARTLGVKVTRQARTVRIATARSSLKKAGTAQLKLRLGAGLARSLKKLTTLKLTLTASLSTTRAVARGARTVTSSRTLTLKR